jgi:hypothetical protein
MKRINIDKIDKLIDKSQYGSNSELFEFRMFALSKRDNEYSISFNYTSNKNSLTHSGYFILNREILNYTDERGRDRDVCILDVRLWEVSNPSVTILKDTVITMEIIRHYDLLYLFLRSYINQIIG